MDELLNWLDSKADCYDSLNSVLRAPMPDFNSIQDFVFDPPLSPPPPPTIADKSDIAAIASDAPPACHLSSSPTGASGFMNTSCDSAAAGKLTGAKPDSGGEVACSFVPIEEMEKVRLGGESAFEEGSDSKVLGSGLEGFTELKQGDDGGEIRQASSAEGEDLGNLNEGPVSCNATVQSESGDDSSSCSSDSESTDDSDDDDGSDTDEEEDDDGDGNDDDKKVKQNDEYVDMEEGEIRGLEASREAVESDDEEIVPKGPIRSKHELEILPHVPSVNVTLERHHQMTPVGTILSIVDTKVIVEGGEKHNPLNEGSILWITESKLPLGYVDEIFGPVKNPFYVVRYNSDKEVPPDIHEGILISFVREFVDHVLNDKDLYKRGYDASGENDEEVYDEAEFSDDEKEAEFKRMQRTAKRGKDNANSKSGDYLSTKRVSGKGGSWKGSRFNSPKQEKLAVNPASGARQFHTPPTQVASFESGSRQWVHVPQPVDCLNGPRQDTESTGVWPNVVSTQHPVLQPCNGILMGDMRFPQQPAYQFYGYPQNHQQYPTLAVFSAQLSFPQQFAPNQGGISPLPQLNFPMGMTSPVWPAAQFPPNQAPLVTGLPGGGQLPSFQGNMLAVQQFNPGNASMRGGRKPFRQGRGGHFPSRQGLQ